MCIEMAGYNSISLAILKPVALVRGIVTHIGRVQDIKIHEESPILKGRWI
jgi:hypothetical protein